ncbi:MAG: hypothetical protein LBD96_02510 [Treponema sp.]|jgi:hypothetical protein|nr:hypothetical protein [Treponema sp.]
MAFIRKRTEERTSYQVSAPLSGTYDFGQDIAIVYGTDPGMPRRVEQYRQRGYVVHIMTGIAWGGYQDYLNGKWDGRDHWDEAQRDRDGGMTGIWVHAPDVPYMVPAISYTDYLTEKLKPAIDAGVEAVYTEEPEFLESGAYSEAFKREYQIYYHEPWQPPHENVDAHYRSARLMAYLYRRAIDRVSAALCEYSMVKYGRPLRFYVPTHSLLNYTQWKVPSPEGTLTDIPTLSGYQAQIWMGTSRTPNVYRGACRERIFETAFLEYGVMQELVRGTGRTIWFNIDPIEDMPKYHWEEYKVDYFKTLIAQLFQPHINRYEICPWPSRIFGIDGEKPPEYPRGAADAKPIPPDYLTLCANIFQTMGTFETDDFAWEQELPDTGVFLSDTAMFQRSVPDDARAEQEAFCRAADPSSLQKYPWKLWLAGGEYAEVREDVQIAAGHSFDFAASTAFPQFFGLAMPLLKGGLPIRPVQLENIVRYPAYLDNYKLLILSYEFQKPLSADVNITLAGYVQNGGILYYCGDGRDPFHRIRSWWNTGKNTDPTPLESLFRLLGLPEDSPEGTYRCGKGRFVLKRQSPAELCLNTALSDAYRGDIAALLGVTLDRNSFVLRRGPYLVLALMNESASDTPMVRKGLFADMLSTKFDIILEKILNPDEQALLFDFDTITAEDLYIIGTSIRITGLNTTETGFTLTGCGASRLRAHIRLRLPHRPASVSGQLRPLCIPPLASPELPKTGTSPQTLPVEFDWDEKTRTTLLSFDNTAGDLEIKGSY